MSTVDRTLRLGNDVHQVTVEIAGDGPDREGQVRVDGGDAVPTALPHHGATRYTLDWGDRRRRVVVARVGRDVEVAVDGERFLLSPAAPLPAGAVAGKGGPLRSPMPGKIVELPVAAGDAVSCGDTVVVVEAMKLRNSLTANADGTVSAVHCTEGDQVAAGDLLVDIEAKEEESDG